MKEEPNEIEYILKEEIMKWLLLVAVLVMVGMAVSSGVAFGDSSKKGDLEIQASVDAPKPPHGITFSVGPDQKLIYPSSALDLPDEHTTFIPRAPGSGAYLVFGASTVSGVDMGAGVVVLETKDLKTFKFADGYTSPVMSPPLPFTSCKPPMTGDVCPSGLRQYTYDSEFDLNYAAPGSVVQDPTRDPGNLIMIYEAENHCPGGCWQHDFYATVGFARSSDNGKTWPQPVDSEIGGPDRYCILKGPEDESNKPIPEGDQRPLGNAIPSAFVDGNYLYVTYVFAGPDADGLIRVARGDLGGSDPISFSKWYKPALNEPGAFSEPGIWGLDSGVLPPGECTGRQNMSQISYNDVLGVYMMTFVCVFLEDDQPEAAWFFSTATSLDDQDWSPPQMIEDSQFPVIAGCAKDGTGNAFDGWYPSFMSPGFAAGHISRSGRVFFQNGCDRGQRIFMSRRFTITGPPPILP